MQNKSLAHTQAPSFRILAWFSHTLCGLGHVRSWFLAPAVLLFALAFSLGGVPAPAYAKEYSMPQVSIAADVQPDGTLHVVERRAFDFDGSFTAVWWSMDDLGADTEFTVNGVRMGVVESTGEIGAAVLESVPSVEFAKRWRTAGGPGTTAYSVDDAQSTCYLFFDVSDAVMVAEIDYNIANAVQVWADCAELYWKFVGTGWAESSRNVACSINLPVPPGAAATPEGNVRAWGHGSLNGSVHFSDDAASVSYEVGRVHSGEYAEARVVFPVEWLTGMSAEDLARRGGEERLSVILAQEQQWADDANRQRSVSNLFVAALALVCVALLVWSVLMFVRHGREYRSEFSDEYWRDVPQKGMHPAVVSRLWNWNAKHPSDFTATIMHLENEGALAINKGSYEKPGILGGKQVEDYYITRNHNYVPTNKIDAKALDILFDKVGEGKDSVWLGSIKIWGEKHKASFAKAFESWQKEIDLQVECGQLFEKKGNRLQDVMAVIAGLLMFAGFGLSLLMENFIPLAFFLPTAAIMFLISVFMPRRDPKANEIKAKCAALKKWLTEFTLLNERPPTDVKVWGEFMVYAFIFGVADKVIAELREVVPQMFVQDGTAFDTTVYHPWYTHIDMNGVSRGIAFSNFVDNTLSTVVSVASEMSSGGGGGGGFSGGGGGGFGGGGGAR